MTDITAATIDHTEGTVRNNLMPQETLMSYKKDGGYGWVCVLSIFLINAHTWGLNAAYSIFLSSYLRSNLFPDATSIEFAYIGGLSISMAFLVSPVVSKLSEIYNTRLILVTGVIIEAISFVAASFSTRTWHLFLTQGVCFGCGMGILYTGTVGILPTWFDQHSGVANALASAGSGVGGLAYSFGTNRMIEKLGSPMTLRVLGIIALVMNSVAVILLKDRRKKQMIGRSLRGTFKPQNLKQLPMVLTIIYSLCSILGYVVLLFSLPSFATTIGLNSTQGSTAAALLSLGQMLGRPTVGFLCDSFNRLIVTGASCLICSLLCLLMWTFTNTFVVLLAFSVLVGLVAGTVFAVIAPILVDVVGIDNLTPALNVTWMALVLPATFSEAIALTIKNSNGGSFAGAKVFTGVAYLGATLAIWGIYALKYWRKP